MLDSFQLETGLALNNPDVQCPHTVAGRTSDGSSRRFNVYRNNRAGSLIGSLRDTYPVLCRLLGDEFFQAAARQFIDLNPPTGPVLSEYGNGFGDFVQQLPGSDRYPYFADVAELEWRRLQSYHAADDETLTPADLQSIEPSRLLASKLTLHSAVAVIESNWAIGSLWSNSQSDNGHKLDLVQAEIVLISRPQWTVQQTIISAESACFMQYLTSGLSIEEAATQCLSEYLDFDTGFHLQGLLAAGTFSNNIH